MVTDWLTMAIVMGVVTYLPLLVLRKTRHVKAKAKACGEKYIDISQFFFWFVYLGGSGFSIVGVSVFLFTDEAGAGLGFIAMGLLFILSAAIIFVLDTSVSWTLDYIYGARSGSTVKKHKIYWDDIISFKVLPNQTFQLQDKSGKSVHWSVYQAGWYEIIEDLRRLRPDIDTSDLD